MTSVTKANVCWVVCQVPALCMHYLSSHNLKEWAASPFYRRGLTWTSSSGAGQSGVLPEGVVSGVCRVEEIFQWRLLWTIQFSSTSSSRFRGWAEVWSGLVGSSIPPPLNLQHDPLAAGGFQDWMSSLCLLHPLRPPEGSTCSHLGHPVARFGNIRAIVLNLSDSMPFFKQLFFSCPL